MRGREEQSQQIAQIFDRRDVRLFLRRLELTSAVDVTVAVTVGDVDVNISSLLIIFLAFENESVGIFVFERQINDAIAARHHLKRGSRRRWR